ncbi:MULTISPECIES: single-stranded DNA-binding protein [unclassified Simplicispira]|jgi:single-stranded DNA-binding protein|uniref:single-stranded DNA-binding protein n=1 Tax=unclassified Simplicispira TaxID=2630407 RepID=UPI000D5CF4F8|nr:MULTISPECIES: single-stranded DNA-binding protein [unclassified Simplicispira]MBH1979161.1 single-stranded DNA-binding protein [Comamonadaceae bacterium]PVY56271.1 single-stranded DNA-binding protein [Simplicispira sp. 125]REG17216.1 single-stranded DNA-binding protein [Simplicispira sp. 110]
MIDGLIAGRLYGQAAERTDKAGKTFTVARVRATSNDGENLFVNVIAFDAASCAALGALADGDSVSLAGTLTPRIWTDKQGNTRPSLDMVAHQVLTAYHANRKRRAMEGDWSPMGDPQGEEFPPEPLNL